MSGVTLFYSEGAGTSRMSVGNFETLEAAARFIQAFDNSRAVWEVEPAAAPAAGVR